MTVSVYSMRERAMSTTHRKVSQAKNIFRGFFHSSLVSRKAVFHRKKVVQLSLNNHCHAILKNVFCFLLDYDSCLVFPPFFILPSKWCLRINCEWQEEKYKMMMRPSFPFFSFILLNHGKYPISFLDFLFFSPS